MKKKIILFFVMAFAVISVANAQTRELQIYQGGSIVQSLLINNIDSIKIVEIENNDNGGNGNDDNYDDNGDGGNYDEYFQITINEETFNEHAIGGILSLPLVDKNGEYFYLYGYCSDPIKISYQDTQEYHIVGGYTSKDLRSIYPKSIGTYDIITRASYSVTEIPENVGMVITGGNAVYRTVTSGSLKITKVTKVNDPAIKLFFGREGYATEGTFSFTLKDNWDGNETKISGKFRFIF